MSDTPDAAFFLANGVPDSQGVSHPKTFPFYLSETNPNANGGCLCDHGDCRVGPFIVFPGDMFDVTNPRPVLCAACVPQIEALLDGKPPEIPDAAPLIELPDTEVEEEQDSVEGL